MRKGRIDMMMSDRYAHNAGLFKALADRNRLQIVTMLSRGEQCACNLLDKFSITQPTFSHHMKILCGCGLVNARKEGKMMVYSLNDKTVEDVKECLCMITGECVCEPGKCQCGPECTCSDDCPCKS